MNDTAPEINETLFRLMMERSPAERLVMGSNMRATAASLVWASIPQSLPPDHRRRAFYERFSGEACPW